MITALRRPKPLNAAIANFTKQGNMQASNARYVSSWEESVQRWEKKATKHVIDHHDDIDAIGEYVRNLDMGEDSLNAAIDYAAWSAAAGSRLIAATDSQ